MRAWSALVTSSARGASRKRVAQALDQASASLGRFEHAVRHGRQMCAVAPNCLASASARVLGPPRWPGKREAVSLCDDLVREVPSGCARSRASRRAGRGPLA